MSPRTAPTLKPEATAREQIDAMLEQAGWVVQDPKLVNLAAGRDVAVREFPLKSGYGKADYGLRQSSEASCPGGRQWG